MPQYSIYRLFDAQLPKITGMANSANKQGSVSVSPFSTGAGGTTFEFLVATDAAIRMLWSRSCRGQTAGSPISEIRLQQAHLGNPVDDVIAISEDGKRRIDIQAKHTVSFTAENQALSDALCQFCERIGQDDFDIDNHRVGLAFDKDSSDSRKRVHRVKQLTEQARNLTSSDDFVKAANRAAPDVAILEAFVDQLKSNGLDTSEEAIFKLFRALVLIPYDIESEYADDYVAMSQFIRSLDIIEKPDTIIGLIYLKIANTAKNGGTITRDDLVGILPADVADALPAESGRDILTSIDRLTDQLQSQIETLVVKGKYIPRIATIPPNFREQSRAFAIPSFALRLIQGRVENLQTSWLSRLLSDLDKTCRFPSPDAFEPTLPVGNAQLERATKALQIFRDDCQTITARNEMDQRAQNYKSLPESTLNSSLYWCNSDAREMSNLIEAARLHALLILNSAGTGKTFAICELATALRRRGCPCLLFEAKQLRADTLDGFARALFARAAQKTTPAEYAKWLKQLFEYNKQPLIVLIDGLNEHPNASEIANRLAELLELPNAKGAIKIVMTCREEYHRERLKNAIERFDGLLTSHLAIIDPNSQQASRMIYRHFSHFRIRAHLGTFAFNTLATKPVLLRVFCETNCGQDSDENDLGVVEEIHTERLIAAYIDRIGAEVAESLIVKGMPSKRAKAAPQALLAAVADQMLSSHEFRQVSLDSISASNNNDDVLDRILDAETLLREDPPKSYGDSMTLAFPLDEVRVWLLVQRILTQFGDDPIDVEKQLIDLHDISAPCFDGVTRLMITTARRRKLTQLSSTLESNCMFADAYFSALLELDPDLLTKQDSARIINELDSNPHTTMLVLRLILRLDRVAWPHLNCATLIEACKTDDRRSEISNQLRELFNITKSRFGEVQNRLVPLGILTRGIRSAIDQVPDDRQANVIADTFDLLFLMINVVDFETQDELITILDQLAQEWPCHTTQTLVKQCDHYCAILPKPFWNSAATAMHSSKVIEQKLIEVATGSIHEDDDEINLFSDAWQFIDVALDIDSSVVPKSLRISPKKRFSQIQQFYRQNFQ